MLGRCGVFFSFKGHILRIPLPILQKTEGLSKLKKTMFECYFIWLKTDLLYPKNDADPAHPAARGAQRC